jgi:2'-5' RNA ligase
VPRSGLLVAVPEAEPLVHEWRLRYDSARLGIPAHITLLFPFVPAEELDEKLLGELRGLFAAQHAISFSLTRLAEFPDQTLWLAPEPSDPFRRLTELIFEHYPDYPPYEGIHEEVIPHLTVTSGEVSLRDQLDAALTPHLPVHAEAGDVVLLEEQPNEHWRTRERFPLNA